MQKCKLTCLRMTTISFVLVVPVQPMASWWTWWWVMKTIEISTSAQWLCLLLCTVPVAGTWPLHIQVSWAWVTEGNFLPLFYPSNNFEGMIKILSRRKKYIETEKNAKINTLSDHYCLKFKNYFHICARVDLI